MKRLRFLTDRDFVDAIRRWQELRRFWGVMYLIFGLIVTGIAVWGLANLARAQFTLSATMTEQIDPVHHEMITTAVNGAYARGLFLGTAFGAMIVLGPVMIILGWLFARGGRRDRLLVQYSDEMEHLQRQLADATSAAR